jgi:hypothetical protein
MRITAKVLRDMVSGLSYITGLDLELDALGNGYNKKRYRVVEKKSRTPYPSRFTGSERLTAAEMYRCLDWSQEIEYQRKREKEDAGANG